ncbi:MAG: hypothetical protein EU539_09905 [Promethearchaeota archaeon]|nr:MAG: hypothetical protein EU539_09905 [Candidatus Lokiarchaeota archaeon]
MKRRNIILINILFVLITVISLIISFVFQSFFLIPFFFLPICCFLPFAFKSRPLARGRFEPNEFETKNQMRYCPKCGGIIREPLAKYCYHCGKKLDNELKSE